MKIEEMTPQEAYDTGYRNGEDSVWADTMSALEERGGFPDGTTWGEAMQWCRRARAALADMGVVIQVERRA